jgi:hypothetical protein
VRSIESADASKSSVRRRHDFAVAISDLFLKIAVLGAAAGMSLSIDGDYQMFQR